MFAAEGIGARTRQMSQCQPDGDRTNVYLRANHRQWLGTE